MKLSISSHHKDHYPVCGFFIEETELTSWLDVLKQLNLDPNRIEIHAIPSQSANEIWGCLVLSNSSLLPDNLGKSLTAHTIGSKLIIPEKTKVEPELTAYDLEQLFQADTYVLHPDFGLYKLTEPIALEDHLASTELPIINSKKPADYSALSGKIMSFSIEPIPKEELKDELEMDQEREKIEEEPLSFGEKARLKLYEKFLISEDGENGEISFNKNASALDKIAKNLGFSGIDKNEKLLEDFKKLQERNKREVDKLMDLLKNNPEEALKYAIPLDEHGYKRGGQQSEFKMEERELDLSLLKGLAMLAGMLGGGSGGGGIDLGDEYFRIRKQYLETAELLKEKGDYDKAAYIYLKLLKDYKAAAATLKEGKQYQKAAMVYLEYLKDENSAAECYEEGKIYTEAIELYSKQRNFEKVGDLYTLLGSRKSANVAYQLQIDKEMESKKYINAATISKTKMHNLPKAQEILLTGWDNGIDQYNCLRNYLNNIDDSKEVWNQLERISKEDLNASNDTTFLIVLKEEHANQDENENKIKDLAYTLISKLLEESRISSHELMAFNKGNSRLYADTMRYERNKHKR